MRLTAIALAAAVALVGTQGHALVLVGGPPTGEPGEVVRHESSAEGEAQGWSYSEVDESGSWDAAETAAYFADDPDTHDAYAPGIEAAP